MPSTGPPTAPPRLLNVHQVAAALGGIHEQTVRGLWKSKAGRPAELGSVRVGRRRMSTFDHVADYIERHTDDPDAAEAS